MISNEGSAIEFEKVKYLVPYFLNKYFKVFDDDMLQEGYIALLHAIGTFDSSRNVAFSSYAASVIRYATLMYFRKEKKLNRVSLLPIKKLDRPAIDEVEEKPLIRWFGVDKGDRDIIEKYFGFGCEPMLYREIGEQYGVSKERIRIRINRGLERLRQNLSKRGFSDVV